MPAFNDVRCPKCSAKIGWMGELVDQPPCPKCGHKVPVEEIRARAAKVQALMDAAVRRADAKLADRTEARTPMGSPPASLEALSFQDQKYAARVDRAVEEFMSAVPHMEVGDMVVVKIEMWPMGDGERARVLEIGTITNVGGDLQTGNYKVVLQKAPRFGGPNRPDPDALPWKAGSVTGFDRKLSAWELLRRALNALGF